MVRELAITCEQVVLALAAVPPHVTLTLGKYIAPPSLTVPPPLTVTALLLAFGAWSSIRTPFRSEEKVLVVGAERLTVPPEMLRLELPSNTRVTPVPVTVPLLIVIFAL